MIGKPYSGKPTVRFDEGELEIELFATTPALYSTGDLSGSLFSRENEPSSISSRRSFEGAAAFLIREGSP
jgi:hypothetical protein